MKLIKDTSIFGLVLAITFFHSLGLAQPNKSANTVRDTHVTESDICPEGQVLLILIFGPNDDQEKGLECIPESDCEGTIGGDGNPGELVDWDGDSGSPEVFDACIIFENPE